MDRETVEEIKRHFGIFSEEVRSEVRAVAEGQSLTNERLDRVEERFGGLEQRGDRVEQRLGGLELRLDHLDQRVEGLEHRVDRGFGELQSMIRLSYAEIDRRFGALETEMTELRARVERLESRGA